MIDTNTLFLSCTYMYIIFHGPNIFFSFFKSHVLIYPFHYNCKLSLFQKHCIRKIITQCIVYSIYMLKMKIQFCHYSHWYRGSCHLEVFLYIRADRCCDYHNTRLTSGLQDSVIWKKRENLNFQWCFLFCVNFQVVFLKKIGCMGRQLTLTLINFLSKR